jgi:hypothetical protein
MVDTKTIEPAAQKTASFFFTVPKGSINQVAAENREFFVFGAIYCYQGDGFARTECVPMMLEVILAAQCPDESWRRSTARETVHILLSEYLNIAKPTSLRTSCGIHSLTSHLRSDVPIVAIEYGQKGLCFSSRYENDFVAETLSLWVRPVI